LDDVVVVVLVLVDVEPVPLFLMVVVVVVVVVHLSPTQFVERSTRRVVVLVPSFVSESVRPPSAPLSGTLFMQTSTPFTMPV
jgi:hypothetical protein